MRIKEYWAPTGEHVALLIDEAGMPLLRPNRFATLSYRNTGKSFYTSRAVLSSISMAYAWAKASNFNFEKKMLGKSALTHDECSSLADYLRLKTEYQRFWRDSNCTGCHQSNVIKMPIESVRPRNKSSDQISSAQVVNSVTFGHRLLYVCKYMEWLINRWSDKSKATLQAQKRSVELLRGFRPRSKQGAENELLEAVDLDLLQQLVSDLTPYSPNNPFSTPFLQHRNFVMLLLFIATGARRGEIHHLKLSDLDLVQNRIHIRISKTIPRTVPIDKLTAQACDEFITGYWSKLPVIARREGFLLTTEAGSRLSYRGIFCVFETIRDKLDYLPEWFHPHSLRRSFNEQISAMVDQTKENGGLIPEEQERQIRNRLNGWTPNSQMGAKYNRRHIRKKADEIAEKIVNNIVGPGGCND